MLDACVPYSQQACLDSAKRLGLNTDGTNEFSFEGTTYYEKGCYAYKNGHEKYSNMAFYGTGGTVDQMKVPLTF